MASRMMCCIRERKSWVLLGGIKEEEEEEEEEEEARSTIATSGLENDVQNGLVKIFSKLGPNKPSKYNGLL
ncbi:hypothetical protein XANCAGTX0491_009975 [Xanthoria calcicola]